MPRLPPGSAEEPAPSVPSPLLPAEEANFPHLPRPPAPSPPPMTLIKEHGEQTWSCLSLAAGVTEGGEGPRARLGAATVSVGPPPPGTHLAWG